MRHVVEHGIFELDSICVSKTSENSSLTITTKWDSKTKKIHCEDFNRGCPKLSTDSYYIQEYLPSGQTLDSYKQMFMHYLLVAEVKPNQAVAQKISELKERKRTDPVCNFELSKSEKNNEYILDFVLSGNAKDGRKIAEFNVYKYSTVKVNKNNQGLLMSAFSKRAYGDIIKPFLEKLRKDQLKHINQINLFDTPEIKLQ